MRRVTMHKPVRSSSVTRRQQDEAAAEQRRERPEVRRDVRKTWWPDE
ncbi:hypothetical protein [Streptomyces sp. VRA16 Mangrove soil]|nr:hypothetical protein [Streptomyces sp. VRA16 Mangrove soil]MBO1331960.1 hypothetical protein [Streptomyces sp. VRA16 Mangrove soil]